MGSFWTCNVSLVAQSRRSIYQSSTVPEGVHLLLAVCGNEAAMKARQ